MFGLKHTLRGTLQTRRFYPVPVEKGGFKTNRPNQTIKIPSGKAEEIAFEISRLCKYYDSLDETSLERRTMRDFLKEQGIMVECNVTNKQRINPLKHL